MVAPVLLKPNGVRCGDDVIGGDDDGWLHLLPLAMFICSLLYNAPTALTLMLHWGNYVLLAVREEKKGSRILLMANWNKIGKMPRMTRWGETMVVSYANKAIEMNSWLHSGLLIKICSFREGEMKLTAFSSRTNAQNLDGARSEYFNVGLLEGVGPFVGNVETTSMNNVSVVDVSSLGGWVPDVAVTGLLALLLLSERNSRHITKFCDGLNAMKLCDDAGKH
ncbi:hypothetical protein Tco_0351631 [Tanacetum coccineum]